MSLFDVSGFSSQTAAAELVKREQARRRLMHFCAYAAPFYQVTKVHSLIASYLERVMDYINSKGKQGIGRLMILMPPRHGKTELASKLFPAWVMGRAPDTRVILTSYGSDLATANSRAVRAYVESERYSALFGARSTNEEPVYLSSDSRAVNAWDLGSPHRGGVVAAGVGGGITGKGAHLLVIDDPFKNREEAERAAQREMVMDWYRSSAYTRLEDGGAVVLFHTRWHPEDLAGMMLMEMGNNPLADRWTVVQLPAIADGVNEGEEAEYLRKGLYLQKEDLMGRSEGEPLWPDKFTLADLERIRANIGSYDFSALYQQRPYARDGAMFKRDWFTVVDHLPQVRVLGRVRYWDKASTAGSGDYTVGVLMAVTEDGYFYVEHVARGQLSAHARDRLMIETAKRDEATYGGQVVIWHEQEPGSSGKDAAQLTNRLLGEFLVRQIKESGRREVRAMQVAAACEAGRVRLIRAGWNHEYIEELVAYPKGAHDDQVDATAGAFGRLQIRGSGIYI